MNALQQPETTAGGQEKGVVVGQPGGPVAQHDVDRAEFGLTLAALGSPPSLTE